MDSFTTYYELLGVPANASTEEIHKAYRLKAKEYHPDANGGTEESTQLFQRLGKAKDCLIDPEKRLEYDYSIGVKRRPYEQRTYSGPNPDPSQQYGQRTSSSSDAMWGMVAMLAVSAFFAWLFGDDEEEEDASKRGD